MPLCLNCLSRGYCRRLRVEIVGDEDLANPEYIRDLRAFALGLGVNDEDWREFVSDLYRDYRGWIARANGTEIFLDMDEFERPSIREWFRDFCCTPCPAHVTPRVKPEAWERVRVLATILSATYPHDARFWGLRGDNDNTPQ